MALSPGWPSRGEVSDGAARSLWQDAERPGLHAHAERGNGRWWGEAVYTLNHNPNPLMATTLRVVARSRDALRRQWRA